MTGKTVSGTWEAVGRPDIINAEQIRPRSQQLSPEPREAMRRDRPAATVIPLLVVGVALGLSPPSPLGAVEPRRGLPAAEFVLQPGIPVVVPVPAPVATCLRSTLVSIKEPSKLASGIVLQASVGPTDGSPATAKLTKFLHVGDPDVHWTVRQPIRSRAQRFSRDRQSLGRWRRRDAQAQGQDRPSGSTWRSLSRRCSPEYQTLLDWINGPRLPDSAGNVGH